MGDEPYHTSRYGRNCKRSASGAEALQTEAAFNNFRTGLKFDSPDGSYVAKHRKAVSEKSKSKKDGSSRKSVSEKSKSQKTVSGKNCRMSDKSNNSVRSVEMIQVREARLKLKQTTRRWEEEIRTREQQMRNELLPLVEDKEQKELAAGLLSDSEEDDEEEAGSVVSGEIRTAQWIDDIQQHFPEHSVENFPDFYTIEEPTPSVYPLNSNDDRTVLQNRYDENCDNNYSNVNFGDVNNDCHNSGYAGNVPNRVSNPYHDSIHSPRSPETYASPYTRGGVQHQFSATSQHSGPYSYYSPATYAPPCGREGAGPQFSDAPQDTGPYRYHSPATYTPPCARDGAGPQFSGPPGEFTQQHFPHVPRDNQHNSQIPVPNTVHSNMADDMSFGLTTWIDEIPDGEVEPDRDLAYMASFNLSVSDFKIDSFTGNPAEWMEFSMSFKNRIHDNRTLTNSQRLGYLHKYLSGVALNKVYGWLWDGRYYGKAMRTLQKSYGNPSRIIEAQKALLLKPDNVVKKGSDIPKFCAAVGRLVQTFQSMGYTDDLRSISLLSDLKARVPDYMLESWGRYIVRNGRRPDILLFYQWLSDKEESMMHGGKVKPVECSPSQKTYTVITETESDTNITQSDIQPEWDESGNPHQFATTIPLGAAPRPKCTFCAAEHWLDKCSKFLEKSSDERYRWFMDDKRCFICSRKGHRSGSCRMRRMCTECGKRHHVVIHDSMQSGTKIAAVVSEKYPLLASQNVEDSDVGASCHSLSTSGSTYLPIVPVRIHTDDGRSVVTHALIDSGSQTTLIREQLASSLRLNGRKTTLTIGSVLHDESPQESMIVHFSVSNPHDRSGEVIQVSSAWTVKELNLPGQAYPRDNDSKVSWPEFQDLGLEDVRAADVCLLIGVNVAKAFTHCEMRKSAHGPTAVRSPLGWYVMGAADESAPSPVSVQHVSICLTSSYQQLCEQVTKFRSTEEFGCKFNLESPQSVEDREAIERLQTTLRKVDGHYQVSLLWKSDSVSLPYNKSIALRRFRILESKLKNDEELRFEFESIVNGYVDCGYARELSEPDVSKISGRTSYVPQQAHRSAHKKLRVVNDCRQPCDGTSLNDALVSGPQLTSSLVGVLTRFRCGPVAVGGDIKAMFHQVYVTPQDRDSLRFLWKPDMSKSGAPGEYQMNVHLFGAKSSPCCASFALQQTARDGSNLFSPNALRSVLRNFYVDDFLKSFRHIQEAIAISQEIRSVVATGGFELTKWVSNSAEVMEALDPSAHEPPVATYTKDLNLSEETVTRTLGVHWSVSKDVFTFRTALSIDEVIMTKRGLLSAISTIFDPLGLLIPYTLALRLLLQKLWEAGRDWDAELSVEEISTWRSWLQDVAFLHHFEVDRCFWKKSRTPVRHVLHTFSDASEKAFAAVAYLQTVLDNGEFHNSIVMARARVAPVRSKQVRLPRLELQGAVLAAREAAAVRQEFDLDISAQFFWTDSMIVCQSIANESRRFKTFEANRLAEIHTSTKPNEWLYVPGGLNPADDATRGLSITELKPTHRWLRGPEFLWHDESGWPDQKAVAVTPDTSATPMHVGQVNVQQCPINCSKYEKLSKLIVVTAYCLRYIHNLRAAACKTGELKVSTGGLTVAENQQATMLWIKTAQSESYAAELDSLSEGNPPPRSSGILELTPMLVNGVLRMRGRLENSTLPYNAKHPIILSHKHPFAALLVQDAHRSLHHFGPEYVIAKVRERYWITNVRTLAKQAIYKCIQCHRRRVEPCVPIMAQLPTGRIDESFPFSSSGLDYVGHVFVKLGRRQEKRWISLFTCLTTRAVHLELVNSLSTDAFIMSFRRFIARRGSINEVYSDRGTNYVGADRELNEAINRWNQDPKLSAYLRQSEITWHFNPPSAPHFGGAWERVVKSCKVALYAALTQHKAHHEDTLATTLCEVEATLNSRPLTVNSDDSTDPVALTPNHFLLNRASVVIPTDVVLDSDSVSRKRWRQSQSNAEHFWKRFRMEYLPGLNVTRKWKNQQPNVSVGDVVLVIDDGAPRGCWPLGRITAVCPSIDGVVRKVEGSSGTYTRPVAKLCLLEGSHSLK